MTDEELEEFNKLKKENERLKQDGKRKDRLLQEKSKVETPVKLKASSKKQIEDYLFLYETLLSVFGVGSWNALKVLIRRDEHGKIFLNLEHPNILTHHDILELVEVVNEYEGELKRRYKNNFEYTDYQIFSILFSEIFLTYKESILEYMQEHIAQNAKEICLVEDDFDFSDERAIAQASGGLTRAGEIKKSFKMNEVKKSIITHSNYFKAFNRLAYYMATGSGKTVILHTNILV